MDKIREINLGKIGKLILSEKVQEYIDCLHNRIESIEWSGILFYKLITGDIKNMKDLVFQSDFIYPRDIGDAVYTSTNATGDLVEAYDIYEDGLECSTGLIHTHHSMQAFFSGTDMSELRDNAKIYNYYLSLIVNFNGNYCCKIAIPGSEVFKSTITLLDSEGHPYYKEIESTNEILFIGDIDVEHNTDKPCEKWLEDKIKQLFDKKNKKKSDYLFENDLNKNIRAKYDLFYDTEIPIIDTSYKANKKIIKLEITPKQFLMELLATGSIENDLIPEIVIEENLIELCEDYEYANTCLSFIYDSFEDIYEDATSNKIMSTNFLNKVKSELKKYESKFGDKYFYIKLKELLKEIIC